MMDDAMRKQIDLLRQVRQALRVDDLRAAADFLAQTVELARAMDDVGAQGRHLGNLALIYNRLNQPEQALQHFRSALACARQDDDRYTENGILGNMGNILREMGRHDQAREYLQAALTLADDLEDRRGRGIWLSNLGLLYDDLGHHAEAQAHHHESVEIARALNDQRGLAARLDNLASSHLAAGELKPAIEQYHQVAALLAELGAWQDLLAVQNTLGDLYTRSARRLRQPQILQSGLTQYRQALQTARRLQDLPAEAHLMRTIGHLLGALGDHQRAAQTYLAASRLFESLGMVDAYDATLRDLDAARQRYQNG
jgi:tetratricopeptide (TPR) repeat protein